MDDLGALLAIVGFGNLVAFSQTSRHLATSRLSWIYGLLTLPMGIALLWRIALSLGWWTVLVFISISLMVGYINARAARNHGVAFLYSMQTSVGTIATVLAIACWFV